MKKVELDPKMFESIATKDLVRFVCRTVAARAKQRTINWFKDIKNELLTKPFGRIFVMWHINTNKAYDYAYKKGWIKQPKDSLEEEFDRKTENCFYKIYQRDLLALCKERESGNTSFYAVQNNKPIFTAFGAWANKEWINKLEFDLANHPYSKSFTTTISQQHLQNNVVAFEKDVRDVFLDAMDIDQRYSQKTNSAVFSQGIMNMPTMFTMLMFQNEQMDFWLDRFIKPYMRLVHLEQRKLDVSLKHINDLKLKWEQEVVNEFMLGVTLLGLTKYAFIYKSLPLVVQKRVPNFHARQSFDKKGVYKKPKHLLSQRVA